MTGIADVSTVGRLGPDHPGAKLGKQMAKVSNGDAVSRFENGYVGQQSPHRSR